MTENTARQYEQENIPVTPRTPTKVIPLHPTLRQRGKVWPRLTPEQIADVVLAVTTIALSGVLFLALYRGLQHYMIF
jgi:hypothetical protein